MIHELLQWSLSPTFRFRASLTCPLLFIQPILRLRVEPFASAQLSTMRMDLNHWPKRVYSQKIYLSKNPKRDFFLTRGQVYKRIHEFHDCANIKGCRKNQIHSSSVLCRSTPARPICTTLSGRRDIVKALTKWELLLYLKVGGKGTKSHFLKKRPMIFINLYWLSYCFGMPLRLCWLEFHSSRLFLNYRDFLDFRYFFLPENCPRSLMKDEITHFALAKFCGRF